ncbi:hypothetical protein ACNOYE_33220 [Nannocystaceae bacterium ST9]
MTTIKILTRSILPTLALLVSLSACGGADKADKKADKKAADKQAKAEGVDKSQPGDKVEAADAGEEPADMPTLDPKVEKAVTLANALAAEPGRADAILEEAGMDRASFQTLLYEIAGDPDLSKSYAVARDA